MGYLFLYNKYKKKFWTIISTIMMLLMVILVYPNINKTLSDYSRELVAIDSLCEVKPALAEKELSEIAPKYIHQSNEMNWYFRFLTIKAKVKANGNIESDIEIKDLINHYEKSGNKRLLPQVYYCAGCIYIFLMDITQANTYFIKAIKILKNTTNLKLLALCYYQLGLNLSNQGLHKEALEWENRSLVINMQRKDTIRCIYDYTDIAWTIGNLGKPQEALIYMFKAKSLACKVSDRIDMSEIERQIAIHYLEMNSLIRAEKHIDEALKFRNDSHRLFSIALDIYMKSDNEGKALEYCDSTLRYGNVYDKRLAYWFLTMRAVKQSNVRKISEYLTKYKTYSDSVKTITDSEASAKALAQYNYGLREKENQELHKENIKNKFYIFSISAVFIITILVFYIIYRRVKQLNIATAKRCRLLYGLLQKTKEMNIESIRQKEEEIKKIKRLLQCSSGQNEKKQIEIALNTKEIELVEINKQEKIIELCNKKIKLTDVYNEIYDIVNGYNKKNFTDWDGLKKTIYSVYPTFEKSINEMRKLNVIEFRVTMLIRVGLDVSEISKIACTSKSNIYSTNKRLFIKNFRRDGASSDWIKFIRSIY